MIENLEILNIFYKGEIVNSILINDGDKLVVIDTGVKEARNLIISEIDKYDYEKLFVIITHSHPDHLGNNHAILEKYKPVFICHDSSRKYVENYELQFEMVTDIEETCKYFKDTDEIKNNYFSVIDYPVKIDITFDYEMNLYCDYNCLKLIHLPGHTIGDIGIIYKKNNLLILSELLFKHSRKTLIYLENYERYISSLNLLRGIVVEDNIHTLITSHEENMIKGQKRILDLISYNIKYIEELKSIAKELNEKKYKLNQVCIKICEIYKKFFTFDSIVTIKALLK